MMIATTGTSQIGGDFLVYHGPYREIIPRMAAAGYKGVEMTRREHPARSSAGRRPCSSFCRLELWPCCGQTFIISLR